MGFTSTRQQTTCPFLPPCFKSSIVPEQETALRESRVSPATEQAIVQMALDQPIWGPVRVAEEARAQGEPISPASVRCS